MQDTPSNAAEDELDVLAERFFSQPPQAWEIEPEGWQPEPMSSIERLAMLTTAAPAMALFAVATTLLISEPIVAAPRAPVPAAARAHGDAQAEPAARIREAPAVSGPPAVIAGPQAVSASPETSVQLPAMSPTPEVARATPHRRARAARGTSSAASPAVTRARKLLDAGDARAARELAQGAIRSAPEQAAGYIVLAGALDKLGDRAGMATAFRTCARVATDKLAAACKALSRRQPASTR